MKKNFIQRGKNGFSVIELITVIAIIAILAVGIGSFNLNNKTEKEKQGRFTDFIIGTITTAKTDAMIGRSVKVGGATFINPSSIQLSFSSGAIVTRYMTGTMLGGLTQIGTGTSLENPFFGESGYIISSITNSGTLLDNVDIQFTGTNITFSGANSPILEIKAGYRGQQKTIEFDRRSGKVQLK